MSLFKSNITQAAQAAVEAAPAPAATFAPQGLGGDDILAASKLLNAEVTVPGMMRPFLPHQGAAYLYALGAFDRWGGCLLGDDMGLGKTAVMLALAALKGKTLVIAPKVARGGYVTELRAMFPNMTFAHIQGHKPPRDEAGNIVLPEADILFMNDDPTTMKKWLTDTVTTTERDRDGHEKTKTVLVANSVVAAVDFVIRDEIHRDKGDKGKPKLRSNVMLAVGDAIRANGRNIIAATGTLLTNGRPVEAYIPLQIVGGPELVKAMVPNSTQMLSFLYRYCAPKKIWNGKREVTDFGGSDRLSELHDALRRTVYPRRDKRDLPASQIPHFNWVVAPLALNGVLDRYAAVEHDVLAMIREERGVAAYMRAARAEALVKMTRMWIEAGVAKAGAAVEYVKDLTDEGKQVILFYMHDEVYDAVIPKLDAAGITHCTISGKVGNRDETVADFQAGKAQVCVANIKAAGMAVTLTAASDSVFIQTCWASGDMKQAADRNLRCDTMSAIRAEGGEKITWHVLQACYGDGRPTFDAGMWAVIEAKTMASDAVNAGKEVTMPVESVMEQALAAWFPMVGGD